MVFDRVLAIGETTPSSTAQSIGTPYVDGATVKGEVVKEVKGEKIHVIKYKRRKGYRRKIGHRQQYAFGQDRRPSTAESFRFQVFITGTSFFGAVAYGNSGEPVFARRATLIASECCALGVGG